MATNEKLDFVRINGSGTVQYYVPPQTGKLLSDNWMDILLSGSFAGFDTEKNVLLLERIINWLTSDNDIILDSFAGSGTTAHAVLKANAADGGHRQFICIELMDYADTITAERVKRVINGYGEGKSAVSGIPGDFSYFELGAPIITDGFINSDASLDAIRSYVYYTEAKEPMPASIEDDPYLLGVNNETAIYFCYRADSVTILDHALLSELKTKADSYLIYADINGLDDEELRRHRITFKKIPRDIAKF